MQVLRVVQHSKTMFGWCRILTRPLRRSSTKPLTKRPSLKTSLLLSCANRMRCTGNSWISFPKNIVSTSSSTTMIFMVLDVAFHRAITFRPVVHRSKTKCYHRHLCRSISSKVARAIPSLVLMVRCLMEPMHSLRRIPQQLNRLGYTLPSPCPHSRNLILHDETPKNRTICFAVVLLAALANKNRPRARRHHCLR